MAGFLQGLSDFFLGSKPQAQQLNRFTPQQQGVQDQGIQNLLRLLQGGQNVPGQAPGFAPLAQKAQTQFNTQTIPGLAERFTAMGGQNSSAFQGALGSAGAGLNENLAALESQYGLQQNAQNQQLMQLLSGIGFQPQFENIVSPGQPGALHGLAQGFGSFLPFGISNWLTERAKLQQEQQKQQ